MERTFLALAGISGALAVAAGAFGAHALKARLEPDLLAIFHTGAQYHLVHALALAAAAWAAGRFPSGAATAAGWLFLAGTVIFSGSLYALALTGVRALGAVTPLGGVAFIAGWVALALAARRSTPRAAHILRDRRRAPHRHGHGTVGAMPPADRYPPQIKFIVGNEGCERFSFYGMRAILTVYMAGHLLLPEHEARANFHWFVTACYLTPLVGAWLAERFYGRFAVILWLSLGYVAGHATIALWDSRWGLLVGLALVALGSGGIKPCVSAFVGDQFEPGQRRLVERVYALFYWIVNLGSFAAKLVTPALLGAYGPAVAFAIPGVLMAVAVLVFRAGRREYVRAPPSGPDPHSFPRVVWRAVQRLGTQGGHWLDAARDRHPAQSVEGAKAVLRILALFAAVVPFWALFDQQGSSWPLQAQRMDLAVGPWRLHAAQLAALNPLLVLVLVPVFTRAVFPLLERSGVRATPLGRMGAGMILSALSFVAAALVEHALAAGARPSAAWQLPQYLLLTSGEVLVSVTGLEFSYTQAPRAMKSTIMSLWLLSVAAGNLVTAAVSQLNLFHGPAFFWFFVALMLSGALAFRALARRYRPTDEALTVAHATAGGERTFTPLPRAGSGEALTQRFNLPRRVSRR